MKRTAVLAEVANSVPALTPLVTKRHGTKRPADCRLFSDELQGDQDCRLLQRCPTGGGYGAGAVLSGVATGAEPVREELEGEGVGGFAFMDDISLGLMGVSANTI